jgi:hypothetical protein
MASDRDPVKMVELFPTTIDFSHLGVTNTASLMPATAYMPNSAIVNNEVTMTSSSTGVAKGETFTVAIGLDLTPGTKIAGFEFFLDYDQNKLRLVPGGINFPANLTSASTGPFFFPLSPKGIDAQGSGDVIELTFTVLDDSEEAAIVLKFDRASTTDDVKIIMPNPSPVVINQPETFTFTSTIIYQPSPTPATVSLYINGSDDPPIATAYTTGDNGAYTLSVPIAPADTRYKLVVTKPGYLSYTIRNLTLADLADTDPIDVRQLAGDVNGDGIINAVDLTQLLSEFNREPVIYKEADIDGNGIVNAADLTYLLAGFNKRAVEIYID